jgi:LETM1 and EF-hand domain-containing protein 1, mitochondrial
MSLNRAAHQTVPRLLRNPAYAHLLRANRGRIPSHITVPAIALFLPNGSRLLNTDTSTSGPGGSGVPPPGFNLNQAKRPLQNPTDAEKTATTTINVPKTSATAIPKTEALESASLTELASSLSSKDAKNLEQKKEEAKKLTIWQKVKKEAAHYWDGTKLLATEVRISFKLALKMAAGYELTRRENRQLQRTVQDLGRITSPCRTQALSKPLTLNL